MLREVGGTSQPKSRDPQAEPEKSPTQQSETEEGKDQPKPKKVDLVRFRAGMFERNKKVLAALEAEGNKAVEAATKVLNQHAGESLVDMLFLVSKSK